MAIETLYLSADELELLTRMIGHSPSTLYAQSLIVRPDGSMETNVDGWLSVDYPQGGRPSAFLCLANSLRDLNGQWDVPRFQLTVSKLPKDIPVVWNNGLTFTSFGYSEVQLHLPPIAAIEVYESDWTDDGDGVRFDSGLRFICNDGQAFSFVIDTSILCRVQFFRHPDQIAESLSDMTVRVTLGSVERMA